MLLPLLSKAREQSKAARCCSNLHQLAHAATNQASYGFSSSLNFARLSAFRNTADVVMVADAGVNSYGQPITATHLMSPAKGSISRTAGPTRAIRKGFWSDGWMVM